MSQLTIPDETFERLSRRAAGLNLTVEQFATSILERAAETPPGSDLPDADWKARFDELLALARSRAGRYPAGFQADISREAMYDRRGE